MTQFGFLNWRYALLRGEIQNNEPNYITNSLDLNIEHGLMVIFLSPNYNY